MLSESIMSFPVSEMWVPKQIRPLRIQYIVLLLLMNTDEKVLYSTWDVLVIISVSEAVVNKTSKL
jgi:hypothetical protein